MSIRKVLVGALLAAASLVVTAGSGAGAGPSTAAASWPPAGGPLPHQSLFGLDPRLSDVTQSNLTSGSGAALTTARAQGLATSGNSVRLIIDPTGSVDSARAAIGAAGGTVEASVGGQIQALVPPSALTALAGSSEIADLSAPAKPFAQAVDEGVAATDAGAWQTAGYGGANVKVAIIDLGFQGYQSLLGTALPASVTTDNRCGGAITSSPVDVNTNHGTAVAEIVHQMAPGAQLYLMCIDTELDLKLAEQDAIADGVKIVNHSIAWFNTSRGDGTGGTNSPDATVADARAHGILWVNSAGNYATQHWSGTFSSDPNSADTNDFAPGVTLNQVTIQSGEQACAFLKWDDWPVTSEDFDLVLVRISTNTIVNASLGDQADGPAAPTEELCYTNTGSTQSFGLGIVRYSAAQQPRFDLFYSGTSSLQFQTLPGSVPEPATSPEAVAVGADCWQSGTVEPFTSQGPTIDGRIKPDLVAPDGVSTSTFGNAGSICGQSGFLGTSASSPQVAGAAAVVLSRNPAWSPATLEAALEETSIAADGTLSTPTAALGHGRLHLGSPTTATSPVPVAGPPAYGGGGEAGRWLAAGSGKWTPSAGTTISFAWSRCQQGAVNCTPIAGISDSTYLMQPADYLSVVKVTVTGTNAAGSGSVSSTSGPIQQAPPVALTLPTLMGVTAVGRALSVASNGTWTASPSLAYIWRRCNATGGGCVSVTGFTSGSYTLTNADLGSTIRVTVSATTSPGETTVASSVQTAVVGAPTAPTGVTAVTGNGQATVSFNASTPMAGVLPVTSYTVTSSPGGKTVTGGSSPIVVTGLTNGTSYTFTVQGTNATGTGAASTPSNAVTPGASTGGGGSGGGGGGGSGGGGGGRPGPDLKVSVTASPTPHNVGDQYAYAITILNIGANSDYSTLTVNLPAQTSYNGALVERGPGCSASGQTVTCPLDFFGSGLQTTVVIGAKINSLGTLVLTTSINSSPAEANPADGAVTFTLNLGGSATLASTPATWFTPPPTTTSPGTKRATTATLTFPKPKPVSLHAKHPALTVKPTASTATTLSLKLYDAKGHKLAGWTKHAHPGRNIYTLRLPAKARHTGHETLRVSETGNPTAGVLAVTLKP